MRKFLYLIVVATLCVFGVALLPTSGKSGTPFPFTTVTPAQLATDGITLSNAQTAAPTAVSISQAASVASSAVGGGTVLETHYMHCDNTNAVPEFNQDCYVSSVTPSSIPRMAAPSGPYSYSWAIVVVDPTSGKALWVNAGK